MKQLTIFKQLIIKVILPVTVALIGLAFININRTRNLLVDSAKEKNHILIRKIQNNLEFEDFALGLVETDMNNRMRHLSVKLVSEYFSDTKTIESANLALVQDQLGMNPDLEDIYVVNTKGVIVNTTFEKDLGLNLFSFGDDIKKYLLNILEHKQFKTDAFSVEKNTNRVKKYSYMPTNDGKYIIELGFYSQEASQVIDLVKNKINTISTTQESIRSVDLFIGEENPISFNSTRTVQKDHMNVFKNTIRSRSTQSIETMENDKHIHYDYIYMSRKNSELYKDGVIRIVTDRTREEEIINDQIRIYTFIFAATILTLILLILWATRSITNPINKLVTNVNLISEGKLNERSHVVGNKEISNLSQNFNHMLDRIEGFYNELEQKVRERTAEIRRQKDEIEEQKKRMTDSIHYAKRIQSAILPTPDQLEHMVHEHFVLFKPKDIVSGDFYWAAHKHDITLIAAADCTGHGVPGAFMSMIGSMLLNKIVNEQGTTNPGDVLYSLRDEVINSLKQTGGIDQTKDGMDIALCAIDYTKMKVYFSGAHNPMVIVRDGQLTVYDGDKQPVGYFKGLMNPFHTAEVDIQKGDNIYIFTDGYPDQFGGPDGRKFMIKRLKELLSEISVQPMANQWEILNNTIDDWMVNSKQIDDILVIGIRV